MKQSASPEIPQCVLWTLWRYLLRKSSTPLRSAQNDAGEGAFSTLQQPPLVILSGAKRSRRISRGDVCSRTNLSFLAKNLANSEKRKVLVIQSSFSMLSSAYLQHCKTRLLKETPFFLATRVRSSNILSVKRIVLETFALFNSLSTLNMCSLSESVFDIILTSNYD